MATFSNLPNEIKELIFSNCGLKTLINLLLVSKNINLMIGQNDRFNGYCKRQYHRFNDKYMGLNFSINPKKYFRYLYSLQYNKLYSVYSEESNIFQLAKPYVPSVNIWLGRPYLFTDSSGNTGTFISGGVVRSQIWR